MPSNNSNDRVFLSDLDPKPYTPAKLLTLATYTDCQDLKQRCFEDAHNLMPGVFTTREHFDKICAAIAERELKSRLEKSL